MTKQEMIDRLTNAIKPYAFDDGCMDVHADLFYTVKEVIAELKHGDKKPPLAGTIFENCITLNEALARNGRK